jgi:hypothetical protein
MNRTVLLQKIQEIDLYVRTISDYLRENSKKSSQEDETSKFLRIEISKSALPVTLVSSTEFFAVLDTGRMGETVGVHAGCIEYHTNPSKQ